MVNVSKELFSEMLYQFTVYLLANKLPIYIVLLPTDRPTTCTPASSPNITTGPLPSGAQVQVAVDYSTSPGSYRFKFSGTYTPSATMSTGDMILMLPVGSNTYLNTAHLCGFYVTLQQGITYTVQMDITITYPTAI